MSKKYVCDICNSIIDNPYKARMREFYVGFDFTNHMAVPVDIKTFKTKIDICGCCFDGLRNAAIKKEKNDENS